ncbi:hypothetical protein [Paenibacillus pinihumi]|uniref:hypothetical protein n=1 Tax=Paenibacillus pinihumi TaxID=669462 RepID=UPI0004095071|nr:hypothetical protein [Paenibacillus pinihumi]
MVNAWQNIDSCCYPLRRAKAITDGMEIPQAGKVKVVDMNVFIAMMDVSEPIGMGLVITRGIFCCLFSLYLKKARQRPFSSRCKVRFRSHSDW